MHSVLFFMVGVLKYNNLCFTLEEMFLPVPNLASLNIALRQRPLNTQAFSLTPWSTWTL